MAKPYEKHTKAESPQYPNVWQSHTEETTPHEKNSHFSKKNRIFAKWKK